MSFFKTLGKIIRGIVICILSIILLVVGGSFIYNQVQIKKDEGYWKNPPGQMVEVDGHKMHVYTEGEGEHTIVLLTGFGTACPYVDFLPICQKLSSDYKVVIVERFGYGLSDTAGGKRSFDKIVDHDREALKQAGIEGPYVLCPHSISGLESLIWAQNYPEEVEAIVGMDMSDVSIRDDKEFNATVMQFVRAVRASGLIRLLNVQIGESSVDINSEEGKLQQAVTFKSYMNKDVISEITNVKESCDLIDSKPLPETPTLQLIAQKRTAEEYEAWKASHQKIVDASKNGKLVELDCNHYVYKEEPDRVVQEIKEFLEKV